MDTRTRVAQAGSRRRNAYDLTLPVAEGLT